MKTYHGSCHCGDIKYTADLDLTQGTFRCNCTYCRKTRNWIIMTQPGQVKITQGEDKIAGYLQRPGSTIRYAFCANCGVRLFTDGSRPTVGEFLNLAVATLDDASEEELIAAPMKWGDGLHDDWMAEPGEVRHL